MLCYDLERWDREGGREAQEGEDMGIYVCIWLIHFVVQQKLTQYCKAIILQKRFKKKQNFKKKKKTEVCFSLLSVQFPGSSSQPRTISTIVTVPRDPQIQVPLVSRARQ